jgi:hypothetical protein
VQILGAEVGLAFGRIVHIEGGTAILQVGDGSDGVFGLSFGAAVAEEGARNVVQVQWPTKRFEDVRFIERRGCYVNLIKRNPQYIIDRAAAY